MKKISGIYTITNLVDGKMYVGLTTNICTRLKGHKLQLLKNKHTNVHLQFAWNKYGEENFKFDLLEEWSIEHLFSMENYWCNMLNTHNDKYGYNIQPTSPLGFITTSQETKLKQSLKSKGHKRNVGRVLSEETKKAIANAHLGKKMSEEFKKNCSDRMKGKARGKGYKHTDEAKEKIRVANTGKKSNISPEKLAERNAKISESLKGKSLPDFIHERAREANMGNTRRKGIPHTEEDKIKIKAGVAKAKHKIHLSRLGNTNKLGYRMSDEQKAVMKEKRRLTILKKKETNDKRTDTI